MSVSRRDVLLGLAGVGVAGCTAPPDAPAPVIESIPAPRERLADGPTPQHLLLADFISAMYGDAHLTVYGDGLATYHDRETRDRDRRPPVHLLRLDDGELRGLQAQLAAPAVVGAAPYYATKMKDGGLLRLAIGARRIGIHARPIGLPPEVAAVQKTVDELKQRFKDRGQDAFTAAEPRLLVIYSRWFITASTSDQLMVWANGLLDYRITASNTPYVEGKDAPEPVVRLEQAPRADVAELAALLAGGSFLTAASTTEADSVDAVSGTAHNLLHAGPTVANVGTAFDPSAGQRPVLVALAKLLARFDAAPDEARVMKPKP